MGGGLRAARAARSSDLSSEPAELALGRGEIVQEIVRMLELGLIGSMHDLSLLLQSSSSTRLSPPTHCVIGRIHLLDFHAC